MSYRSQAVNIFKFYRSVSMIAINAACIPFVLLAPGQAVAASKPALPTIEINMEVLENLNQPAPVVHNVQGMRVSNSYQPSAPIAEKYAQPEKVRVASKPAKKPKEEVVAVEKPAIEAAAPKKVEATKKPKKGKATEAAELPEISLPGSAESKEVVSNNKKPVSPTPPVTKMKMISLNDEPKAAVEEPAIELPSSVKNEPTHAPVAKAPEPEVIAPAIVAAPAPEKLPELPPLPVKEHKAEPAPAHAPAPTPVAAAEPAFEKLPELPTSPAKELKAEAPKAEPVHSPVPIVTALEPEKLPELPSPKAKVVKVESPKVEPTPAPAPAPVIAAAPVPEKAPELPTPPVKELKVEAPKAEPIPAPAPVVAVAPAPEKLPELPAPPVKELKVEAPKAEPIAVPAPAPAPVAPVVAAPEKQPELPAPPVRELKVVSPSAVSEDKPEPQKPASLITPMPMPPTPEAEFAKALNAPSSKVEPKSVAVPATAPAPVVAVPEPAPAPSTAPAPVADAKPVSPMFTIQDAPEAPVAPPLPEAKPDAQPTAPEAAKPAAKGNDELVYTIKFISTETDLPLSIAPDIKNLVPRIKAGNERVVLKAYASESADQSTTARRVSLSRVLAVRAFLIENGVDKMNINVQAEGSKNTGGDPDRVDIFFATKNK